MVCTCAEAALQAIIEGMNQASALSLSISPFHDRLQELRAAFRKAGFDGYLVPMADEYQNEYIAPPDRRIRYLTGFTGTAGFAIVLGDRAAFFVDGRYTLQAESQLPKGLYELYETSKKTPGEWLCETMRPLMKIGFDPKLHTAKQIERLEAIALKNNASLVPHDTNLIDGIWTDRPEAEVKPFFLHDATYTGKAATMKRRDIAEEIKKMGVNAAILTDPQSIAWLLNVRGNDVPFAPLPLSNAIIRADGTVEWFVDPRKMTPALESALGAEVTRHPLTDLPAALKRLGEARGKVLIDTDKSSYYILSLLRQSGATVEIAEDPCSIPRACKNKIEIDGMRAAHRRDGAAMAKLLCWLDQNAASGKLNEHDVADKLEELRAEGTLYRGASFATIAGSGPNGAIVHYRASKETARMLDRDSFLLLDSGGQYLDGTTDITRTIPLGTLTSEMKDRYTRVLKGHIAIAALRFPEGTTGAEIDVLARQYLWAAGLDYSHGTGHGVGCYLSVHEGPQSISRRGAAALLPGMVLSNEPGYYKARYYGIRLENLQYVIEVYEISSTERKMFGFEPLTLVPFDRRAIATNLLTADEVAWLDAYHARVHKAIRPQLDEATGQWLAAATAPLESI